MQSIPHPIFIGRVCKLCKTLLHNLHTTKYYKLHCISITYVHMFRITHLKEVH